MLRPEHCLAGRPHEQFFVRKREWMPFDTPSVMRPACKAATGQSSSANAFSFQWSDTADEQIAGVEVEGGSIVPSYPRARQTIENTEPGAGHTN